MKFYSMDWYIPQLKRIQYKISDHTDDKSVFYDDAIAEIEKLRAENARLTEAIRWEENRAERIGTHDTDCWKWGPSHYECALREIKRLKATQKVLQADEVTEPGWYWWRKGDGYEWFPKQLDLFYVERMNKSVLIFWHYLGTDEQNLYGEFIGPIPYPDNGHADD